MGTVIYDIADFSNYVLGYWPSIALPFVIIILLALWLIKTFSFNLVIFAAFFSIFPALTPSVTQLLGYKYFTMLNYDLQQDPSLIIAATFLIFTFTAFFLVGATLPNKIDYSQARIRHVLPLLPLVLLFSLVFILLALFLEAGTVLTTSYGEMKFEKEAPYSSLVNQFFNVCAALFLSYVGGAKRQRLIAIFYIIMIALLLILSRRTLAIGILLLLLYHFESIRFTFRQVVGIFISLALMVFIGDARDVGILNYLQGVRSAPSEAVFFSLSGGASNIFVGTMGVIHMHGRDILSFPETMPIFLWPFKIYESDIYGELSYDYNGGMHIANILYWNFGLAGVIFGGLVLGWITMRVHLVVRRLNAEMGGTLAGMLSFGFILTMPNLFWYHPIGITKLSAAILAGFAILTLIKGATRANLVSSS